MAGPLRTGSFDVHPRIAKVAGCAILLAVAVHLPGCRARDESTRSLRLVDLFDSATIDVATPPVAPPMAPMEWRFDEVGEDALPTRGWQAHDVDGLEVRNGRLRGRAATASPVLYAERPATIDEDDLLHAVEIAVRLSEGGQLSVTYSDDEEPDIRQALDTPFPWPLTTPIVPGDEARRYTLEPSRPVHLSRIRHILLRPTDVETATFELESVRLISRHEHLASIESGVGWHGMDDVFRESIVTRSPQSVSFPLTLPEDPWLDLAVATIEDGAATFRVEARPEGGEPLVFERTVTRPHRWDRVRLPLDALAGRRVELSLRLKAERDGFLGFWGTAAVRSRVPADTGAASARHPQGVIVLLADTLRSDHVNALGYARETAPILTSLAGQGVLARDCVSQATWTKVSVPSIMTSLYSTTHTVKGFTDRLPASALTMAELFRQAGYATLALTSISFTGQFTNLHQGYEELHESSSLKDSSHAKTAREYIDRLLPWVEAHRDVPFFVFLHVADPHSPYRAYAPFDTHWGGAGDAERLEEYTELVRPHIGNPIMKRFGMPTRAELEQAGVDPDEFVGYELDAYDGSIRAMDTEFGRLLERLRELGLAERTLLAFVSDHGTEFLDHDRHFHGQSVYGELNRVPMLLWGPSFMPRGVELEPTVQTIDLMPTVLELAGLEPPAGIQGRSLLPLMRAAERGEDQHWPRPAITEKALLDARDLPGREYESISLIAGGWKLIHNHPAPTGVSDYELYDHSRDPLNLRDLAAEQPERVRRLATQLDQWRERAIEARLDDTGLEESLDPAELERLRSLGYLR